MSDQTLFLLANSAKISTWEGNFWFFSKLLGAFLGIIPSSDIELLICNWFRLWLSIPAWEHIRAIKSFTATGIDTEAAIALANANANMTITNGTSTSQTVIGTTCTLVGTGNNILKFSKDWKKAYASFYEDKKLMKILNIENYLSFNEIYLTSMEKSWKSLMLVDYKFFLNHCFIYTQFLLICI